MALSLALSLHLGSCSRDILRIPKSRRRRYGLPKKETPKAPRLEIGSDTTLHSTTRYLNQYPAKSRSGFIVHTKVESGLVSHHAHQRQSSPLIYGCINSKEDNKMSMSRKSWEIKLHSYKNWQCNESWNECFPLATEPPHVNIRNEDGREPWTEASNVFKG